MRRHGRLNTCAGCLPKVTGVQRLLPVLAARQKSPPETAAERKLLTMSECAKNVIKGNVPLTPRQMTNMRRRKHDLGELSKRKLPLWAKRKIPQKDGFLSARFPAIMSVLGSLLLQNRRRLQRSCSTNLIGYTNDCRDRPPPSQKPVSASAVEYSV